MNLKDYILLALIGVLLFMAIRKTLRDRKKGCCGCCECCECCAQCQNKKDQKATRAH